MARRAHLRPTDLMETTGDRLTAMLPTTLPGDDDRIDEVQQAVEAIASDGRRGQAFSYSAERNRAIEDRAIRLAEAHFQSEGWEVRDVSAQESFDLLCRRGPEELRVEVKGTSSAGLAVLLTANEVRHAMDHHPNVALCVVYGVRTSATGEGIEAEGGTVRLLRPWNLDERLLTPLAFSYALPERP